MAEIEPSVLARQCLGQRLPDLAAWEAIVWRFTTVDARIKLKRLCPLKGTPATTIGV